VREHKKSSYFFRDIRNVVILFRRFLQRYSLYIALLVFLNAGTGFLQAILPLSIAPAVNIVLGEDTGPAHHLSEISLDNLGPTILSWLGVAKDLGRSAIFLVAIIYLLLTFLIAILKTSAFMLSAKVSGKALNDMIIALHDHVLSLPLSFFNSKRQGDVISRFTSDTTATINLLDSLIRGLFQSLIQAVFMLSFMVQTDAILSLAAIGIGGSHFVVTRLLSGWVRRRTRAVYDFYGRMTAALQESLQNIKLTKSFAAEDFDRVRLATETASVRDSLFRFRIARYAEEPVRLVADAFSVCAMLLLAYFAMTSGRLTKTGFGLFVLLAGRVVAPISEFSKHFLSTFAVAGSADRLFDLFSQKSNIRDGFDECTPLTSFIQFSNVSFSYDNGCGVLQDVSLRIKKGEKIAIVGPSGSGKSTLCDLLLRFYDPKKGCILYDGKDIRTFKIKSYRKIFGVVPQETFLINASVRDNILYGRPFDQEKFDHSLRIANADEFISMLPNGVDTLIGDRGVRLSGGQRQRLAIARAIYNRPEILVLDEATSELDTESERKVQQKIDEIIHGMTAFIVAHRMSTIVSADKIVVLNAGCVEAIGTHQQLLLTSPTYRKLHSQYSAPDGIGEPISLC